MRSLRVVRHGCASMFVILALLGVAALTTAHDHRAHAEARLEKDQRLKAAIEASHNPEALRIAALEFLELSRTTDGLFSDACGLFASVSGIVAINFAFYWFLLLRAEREFYRSQNEKEGEA